MVPLSLEAIGGPRTLHSTLSSVIKHQFPSSPKSLKLHLELWYHSQFYHESLEIMALQTDRGFSDLSCYLRWIWELRDNIPMGMISSKIQLG